MPGERLNRLVAPRPVARGGPVQWPRLGARLKLSSALATTVPTDPPNTLSELEHCCVTIDVLLSYKFGRHAALS